MSDFHLVGRAAIWLAVLVAVAGTRLEAASTSATAVTLGKTLNVLHGKPIVCVSDNAVLVFELRKESQNEAKVIHTPLDGEDWRALYRFKAYDHLTGKESAGDGALNEYYRNVGYTDRGRTVEDAGSHTRITAGGFSLGWSVAVPGAKSWLYYRSNGPMRLIEQETTIPFDAIGLERLKGYLSRTNIAVVTAGDVKVEVMGPAVFAEDVPTSQAVSAVIQSCEMINGVFHLSLARLRPGARYVLERSVVAERGGWKEIDSFVADQSEKSWTDSFPAGTATAFFRVREVP